MATIDQLWDQGARRIQLPSWERDTYMELWAIGELRSPIARLRCVRLEQPGMIDLLKWNPKKHEAPIATLSGHARADWVAYEGELAPEMEDV